MTFWRTVDQAPGSGRDGGTRLRVGVWAVAVMAALLAVGQGAAAAAPLRPGGDVQINVLSNRADLISGGDALVEVALPSGASPSTVSVDVDGRSVTNAFAVRPDGRFEGVIDGLHVGDNVVTARLPDSYGARITIKDHPIGGPVFAGTQVQPWTCTTDSNSLGPATDAQCDAPTVYTYSYKNAATGSFDTYDPKNPPDSSQIATTTTDDGHTVPYIVRDERGTIDRGIYDISVLDDPSKPWTPWAAQPGWDHKLGFTFGGGCAPGHSQQTAQSAQDDLFLSRGYMKAVSSIDVNGNSCNAITSAESLMMIQEHIREAYGPIRFTMGDGCSGGAEQQHMIAEQYPGLLDGLRPECDFPDFWTPAIWEKYDCELFTRYFNQTSPQLWADAAQRADVTGGPLTPGDCAEQTALNGAQAGGAYQDWQPDGFGCGVTGPWEYDPTTHQGARCDLQDYNGNALGFRPSDGFANRPIDDVGVQWGLGALESGQITAEQFVDLNEKIGDFDIDMRWQPQRATGDVAGIENMYRTDQISYGANWALVPEIDARADDTYDEHSNIMRVIDRARMDQAVGSHASQVFWTEPSAGAFGEPSSQTHALTFQVMDQWLTNIEKDHSDASQQAKVVRDRPPAAQDGCYQNGQAVDQSLCDNVQTPNELPIQVAGAPPAANILKCQLKPLTEGDYKVHGITFTADQWSRLQATFPNGVCDWSQKGVGQQPPVDSWLTYDGAVGGRPLGAAPRSVPFGPGSGGTGPVACAAARGFGSVSVRPHGRGVRIGFTRRVPNVAQIDVFQVSHGRRILGQRLVARFKRSGSFTWSGHANRRNRHVSDGVFFVRLRVGLSGHPPDTRRVTLVRRGGRFHSAPSFYRRNSCGLLPSFKMQRPVFGGRHGTALRFYYALGSRPSALSLALYRGHHRVRLFSTRGRRTAHVTYRFRVAARRLPRGSYTVRISVRHGKTTVRAALEARRL